MENQITTYFEEQIAACKAAASALDADNRADEAVFEKIRMNVYDIFRTVATAGSKVCGEDSEKLREFLLERLEQIPVNWKTAYEAAEQHGNTEKAHIEQLKLDAAAEIRTKIEEIWGDNT